MMFCTFSPLGLSYAGSTFFSIFFLSFLHLHARLCFGCSLHQHGGVRPCGRTVFGRVARWRLRKRRSTQHPPRKRRVVNGGKALPITNACRDGVCLFFLDETDLCSDDTQVLRSASWCTLVGLIILYLPLAGWT